MHVVVGLGLVSTSPAFMRSIANHPAGLHGCLAKKNVIGHPLLGAGGVNLHRVCHTTVTAPPCVDCVFWCLLISACMFIVSKALLISSATMIGRAREPFG